MLFWPLREALALLIHMPPCLFSILTESLLMAMLVASFATTYPWMELHTLLIGELLRVSFENAY